MGFTIQDGKVVEVKEPTGYIIEDGQVVPTYGPVRDSVAPRTRGGDLGTEKADQVGRLRDLGYTTEEIQEWINTGDPLAGYGPISRAGIGFDQAITSMKDSGNQTIRHLLGLDTTDVDQVIKENARADEMGGLSSDPAAMFGSFAGYTAPYLAGATQLPKLGFTGATALETMFDAGTTPVLDTDNYAKEKLKDIGIAAVTSAGPNLLGGTAGKGYEMGRNAPRALIDFTEKPVDGRPFVRATPEDIAEGDRLAASTGVDMSFGERTGAPVARQLEQFAEESLITRGQVADIVELKAKQLEDGLNAFADSLGPNVDRETIATKIQAYVNEQADELITLRSQKANEDYLPIQSYTTPIEAPNLEQELRKIVNEGSGVGASDDQIRAAQQAARRLEILDESMGTIIGKDVDQLTRANEVDRAGTVWDVREPRYGDALNTRIRQAVELDTAAHSPELHKQLQDAKRNYAKNSEAIDSLEATGLGRIVGKEIASDITGITVNKVPVKKVHETLRNLDPVDLRVVVDYMERTAPEILAEYRGQFIRQAIEMSKTLAATAGRETGQMNPGAFLRAIGVKGSEEARYLNMERLDALFGGTEGYPLLRDFVDVSRRLADSSMANRSGTAIRAETQDWIEKAQALLGMGWGALRSAVGTAGGIAGMRGYVNRMDPRETDTFLTGAKPYRMKETNVDRIRTLPAVPALIGSREEREEF